MLFETIRSTEILCYNFYYYFMIQHTKIHRNYTEEKTIYWRHILNFFRNMVRVQRLNGERFRRGTGVCDRTHIA